MSGNKKEKETIQAHLLDGIEQEKLRIKIKEETTKDLETNTRYKKYFERYHPESVKSFIATYARRKADFIIHGEMYKKMELDKVRKFIEKAKDYFEMIQQDKLLVLQYEWNEGNLKLDGIECNYDFFPLYKDVFSVKYLSPVTKEEVDIMSDYIISFDDQGFQDGYSPYNLVSEDVNVMDEKEGEPDYEQEYLPSYYFFKRKKTGEKKVSKDSLIRYRKEEYYVHLSYKEEERLRGPYVAPVPADPREHLHIYNKEALRDFIKKYESEKILHFHDAYEREMNSPDDMEDKINLAVWHLEQTEEIHSVEANDDWKKSILGAAEKSKKAKTAKALYIVYEEYLNCMKNNIPFMPPSDSDRYLLDSRTVMKERILKGRELASKPRDFNF